MNQCMTTLAAFEASHCGRRPCGKGRRLGCAKRDSTGLTPPALLAIQPLPLPRLRLPNMAVMIKGPALYGSPLSKQYSHPPAARPHGRRSRQSLTGQFCRPSM